MNINKHSFEGDQRPVKYDMRWAPGSYSNVCGHCGDIFTGDKRASCCADCAYGDTPENVKLFNRLNIPFKHELATHNILFFGVHGAQLYGTDTPESDRDFKGVYLPTLEEFIFGEAVPSVIYKTAKVKAEGQKNSKDDVDIELYSLPRFMELVSDGDTAVLDMLHTPEAQTIITSDIWASIMRLRSTFYTKNLSAFIQYARKQAAKYGIKGSRLADMKSVIEYVDFLDTPIMTKDKYTSSAQVLKLKDVWDDLPEGEHIFKIGAGDPGNEKGAWRMYQVCGQKFQETVRLDYMRKGVTVKYNEYGERAKLAEKNEGVDWKAVSHALRACYQLREIYQLGTIRYPLVQADYLREVKEGKHLYNEVARVLEANIELVEELAKESELPETVNRAGIRELTYFWCAANFCQEILDKKSVYI